MIWYRSITNIYFWCYFLKFIIGNKALQLASISPPETCSSLPSDLQSPGAAPALFAPLSSLNILPTNPRLLQSLEAIHRLQHVSPTLCWA